MRPSTVGLVVGMVLGIAGAFGGFGAFVLVAVLAALGFVAGKVVEVQRPLPPGPVTGALPDPGERGRTTIADRVVERIAATAAAEVDAATGTARRVLGVAVTSADRPRVTARVHGEEATVEIDMSVAWPAPVRQVTRRVREHVGERLVTLVGLRSARVDVHVAALPVERAPEQKRVV